MTNSSLGSALLGNLIDTSYIQPLCFGLGPPGLLCF